MAGKCKACNSEHRHEIDDRLRRGDTCQAVAEWLRKMGVSITHPSITRHRDSHVERLVTLEKKIIDDTSDKNKSLVDNVEFLNSLNAKMTGLDVFASALINGKKTQVLLERILENQLILVHELQANYTAGNGSYPDNQIKGLKTIFDMVNSLPAYNDKTLVEQLKKEKIESVRNEISDYVYNAAMFDLANNTEYPDLKIPLELIKKYVINDLNINDNYNIETVKKNIQRLKDNAIELFDYYLREEITVKKDILFLKPIENQSKGLNEEQVAFWRNKVLYGM